MKDTEYSNILNYLFNKTLSIDLKEEKNKTQRDNWTKKLRKNYEASRNLYITDLNS